MFPPLSISHPFLLRPGKTCFVLVCFVPLLEEISPWGHGSRGLPSALSAEPTQEPSWNKASPARADDRDKWRRDSRRQRGTKSRERNNNIPFSKEAQMEMQDTAQQKRFWDNLTSTTQFPVIELFYFCLHFHPPIEKKKKKTGKKITTKV